MSDTNEPNIKCPSCGSEIGLSEAVAHPLRERLAAEFQEKHEADRANISAEAEKTAEEKLGATFSNLKSTVAEQDAKLKQAGARELDLLSEKRELQESRDDLELEVARRMDAERQNIASKAREEANEAGRLKIGEKNQHINDLNKKISELLQRSEQGSVQLQGESLETRIEDELNQIFPIDEITEIKKGVRGADVLQIVRVKNGMDCGRILWEAKNARKWSNGWVAKLRDDQRKAGAELAVLVTTCFPGDERGIIEYGGVWVCEPSCVQAIAGLLRQGLIRAALQRSQESGRNDKAKILYDYICGVEFRQNIEGIVETFVAMKQSLDTEQRSAERQWKKREEELRKILRHTAGMYGRIEGISGPGAVQEIALLQSPSC